MAKLLINYGAKVNVKDRCRNTPLKYVIETCNTKMTELLLTNGSDIKKDPTLLRTAVESGNLEMVEYLSKNGADVNGLPVSSHGTGLMVLYDAVFWEHVEMAKLLINYGAIVNIKDVMRITPLVCAIKTRNTKMIKLLLNNGADIKGDPQLLHTAAEYGYFKLVEDLLKDGADINMLSTSNWDVDITPLHKAVRGKQVDIAKLLINYGSNINAERFQGITPLHEAIQNKNTEMIELLLINGADIKVNFMLEDRDSQSIKLVKQHIAKAKAAGLHKILSESNLLQLNGHEINNFLNRCEAEIEIMKSKMIGNSCSSFYDILIKDTSQLTINESIVWAWKYDDYKTKFPIYASMIDSRFRRLVERRVLLEQVRNKVLHSFFESLPGLPLLCTEKIFSYLSDKDLRILLAA